MVKENKNKDQNGIDIKDKLVAINRVPRESYPAVYPGWVVGVKAPMLIERL